MSVSFGFVISSPGLYRLYDFRCVSDHNKYTKLRQARKDYSFHEYGELCNFIYCLLMKTLVTGSLPDILEWEKYMSVDAVSIFPVACMDSFLENDDFGMPSWLRRRVSFPLSACGAVSLSID